MELTMFQRLQELPLLQGLNMDDMNEIVSKVRLDFQQQPEEDSIALQSSKCKQLIFVLKGTVRVEYIDPNRKFRFCEYVNSPLVIEPQSLFGMNQSYSRSYFCQTDCQTLTIDRSQFLGVMLSYPIVKANTLNYICNRLQRVTGRLESISHSDLETKFRQLLQRYSLNPKGKKHIFVTMDVLADMLCETRLNISRYLKMLSENGLLTKERKEFTILNIENL